MKWMIVLLFLLLPSLAIAKSKSVSTKERAKDMFRTPSGEPQKIDPKFRPIDHEMRKVRPIEKEKTQKRKEE